MQSSGDLGRSGATVTLPAANFTGQGDALVSAMGKAEIAQQPAGTH